MAAYSDTTNEVLALAFDRLRTSVSSGLLEGLKGLAAEGRLHEVEAVRALLDEEEAIRPLYEVDGVKRGLDGWAKATGIPKTTLYHRVVVRGRPMAEALAKGTPGQRKAQSDAPAPEPADCETGV